MDYDSIAKAGSMLGSGAVIVMEDVYKRQVPALNGICAKNSPMKSMTAWISIFRWE